MSVRAQRKRWAVVAAENVARPTGRCADQSVPKRWLITGAGLDPSCAPRGFPSPGSDVEGCWGRQQTRKPMLLLRLSGWLLLR
jgi:hypothetical protein